LKNFFRMGLGFETSLVFLPLAEVKGGLTMGLLMADTGGDQMADARHSRVSDERIRELTESIENGNMTALTKFLNRLSSSSDRLDVLERIEKLNNENRYRSGRTPRLALEQRTYPDSDFRDIALLKKSTDWLFQDDVIYKESIVYQH